ncbi:PPM-type phosphatase-like domain, partial [Dillenia turbinata]
MGICISIASSNIQEDKDGHEDAVFHRTSIVSNEIGSVYSQQGSKGLNQDAAVLLQGYAMEDGAFCGVFDGHGKIGHEVSKKVRNHLPALVLGQKNALAKIGNVTNDSGERIDDELLGSNKEFLMWKEACLNAFKVMDKVIKLDERLDSFSSGTTAVIIIKQGRDLIIANLGDSRAVLGTITEDGLMAIQLTTDLKPDLAKEADRIRRSNGRIFAFKAEPHIQRVWLPHDDYPGLAMSRAFGDFVLKNHGIIVTPDVSYRHLASEDQFIVLATDGVWDVLNNDQVASIVWQATSEETAAKAVVDAAKDAWKLKFPSAKVDDCSVVCLFFKRKA